MKKILFTIYFLLFILFESISYYYNFFYTFNYFLILLFWFNFIYWIYGLSTIEKELRNKEPIHFKLSLFYLFKLIKRSIKIKFIIVKQLLGSLFSKELLFRDFLFLIFIIIISLVFLRLFRSYLILEVIQVFKLDEKLVTFFSLITYYFSLTYLNFLFENFIFLILWSIYSFLIKN